MSNADGHPFPEFQYLSYEAQDEWLALRQRHQRVSGGFRAEFLRAVRSGIGGLALPFVALALLRNGYDSFSMLALGIYVACAATCTSAIRRAERARCEMHTVERQLAEIQWQNPPSFRTWTEDISMLTGQWWAGVRQSLKGR